MEKELISIFVNTMTAHFDTKYGMTRIEYCQKFKEILSKEILDAPKLEVKTGNLATYIKLSILVLTMIKLYQQIGLSEYEIGEIIYKTADKFFHLSPIKKWLQRKLFFTDLNKKQISQRQELSNKLGNGINGFKIRLVTNENGDTFGVDYLQCGICDYFKKKNLFGYVKYCCLVDYAIMKNMGVSFSRTTTIGNGGDKCDFRFSKTGKIAAGWPPDHLKEFCQ
jgi:hypothetical protein